MDSSKPIKLSPSSLNLFVECPRCFWLHHNKGIRRPDTIFPSLPGGMDRILKSYFQRYRGTTELPPIVNGKLLGKLMNPLPKTLHYIDKELGAILYGRMDEALDFGDGTFAPVDHKTRGSAPADEILTMYQLQMDAYDFLMRENGMPTKGIAYLVYYHPAESSELHNGFPFDVTVKEVKIETDHALNVFRDAVKLIRGEECEANPGCSFCAWVNNMKNSGNIVRKPVEKVEMAEVEAVVAKASVKVNDYQQKASAIKAKRKASKGSAIGPQQMKIIE